jgi:hypothetical protein
MARKYEWKHNYAVFWYDVIFDEIYYVNGLTAKEARFIYARESCSKSTRWVVRVQVKNCNHDVPPLTEVQKMKVGLL